MDLRRDEGQREAQRGGQLGALLTPQLAEAGDEQQPGVEGDSVDTLRAVIRDRTVDSGKCLEETKPRLYDKTPRL